MNYYKDKIYKYKKRLLKNAILNHGPVPTAIVVETKNSTPYHIKINFYH